MKIKYEVWSYKHWSGKVAEPTPVIGKVIFDPNHRPFKHITLLSTKNRDRVYVFPKLAFGVKK